MAKPPQQQIIARALEIISDESKWTRGAMARLADGKPCGCLDPRAVCFCAVGALNRSAGEILAANRFYHASEAEHEVLAANNELRDLARVNDIEGREAVIAMFKVALARYANALSRGDLLRPAVNLSSRLQVLRSLCHKLGEFLHLTPKDMDRGLRIGGSYVEHILEGRCIR